MGIRPLCEVQRLGRMPYPEALALQERLVARRRADEIPDQLLLVEHPHVLTLGSAAQQEHILLDAKERQRLGITVHETTRGGDVTYHGPGQLVGYPILQLREHERDAHAYLRRLEETLILTLASYGLEAGRDPRYTGVWVGDAKIAAIGVRLSRWITSHGFALNLDCELRYFASIVPCGIREKRVGSLEQYLDRPPSMSQLGERVVSHFSEVFERETVLVPSKALSETAARS